MVPKSGLSAPRHAASEQLIRALGHNALATAPSARGNSATRISVSLGEVRLNFNKVTHGLAHGVTSTQGSARSAANRDTIWTSRETGNGKGSNQGNSKTAAMATATARQASARRHNQA
jgi:hypothetical protein